MVHGFTPQASPTLPLQSACCCDFPRASTRYCSPPPTRARSPTTPPPRLLPEWDLERAVTKNCPHRVAQILRKDSAAVHAPILDDFGLEMPLVKAARSGSLQVVQLLLDHGARAVGSGASPSPLEALAMGFPTPSQEQQKKTSDALQLELARWCSFEVGLSTEPLPPVWLASLSKTDTQPLPERQLLQAACCLLRAGAQPELRNAQGKTPEDLARAAGRPGLAELLRRADGLRCRKLLQSMWAKRALGPGEAASRAPNDLLDIVDVPKECLSRFLAMA
eukprot:CAMPEP_0115107108 /NCGR_PEP_ID=MMETSP0227-20121206/37107_1 /TAXON_ID=89957 /ORGANISM="Polarella glacialis, Strain CCMP 1383" /LENGTH=277 /DNA_ID=CAMNT_0002504939 /DNA_START=41 /DNA_END=874 /DNA_ORIENTATION=+